MLPEAPKIEFYLEGHVYPARAEPTTILVEPTRRAFFGHLGFSLRIEYGPLTRLVSTMPAYEDDGPTAVESQRAGFYVRLRHGGRSITVGCTQATGFRKHWCSASGGPARARRSVDLWLDPVAFVALQYALVRAGALRLRSPESGYPSERSP